MEDQDWKGKISVEESLSMLHSQYEKLWFENVKIKEAIRYLATYLPRDQMRNEVGNYIWDSPLEEINKILN